MAGFTVLHNDQSGSKSCLAAFAKSPAPTSTGKPAANYFTTLLNNNYNNAIPGWAGAGDRQGLGNLHQKRQQHAIYGKISNKAKRGTTSACATSALKV